MASVASQLIEEVTAHAQSDSLEDAREICADGTYFPNNLRTITNILNTTKAYFSFGNKAFWLETRAHYLLSSLKCLSFFA